MDGHLDSLCFNWELTFYYRDCGLANQCGYANERILSSLFPGHSSAELQPCLSDWSIRRLGLGGQAQLISLMVQWTGERTKA